MAVNEIVKGSVVLLKSGGPKMTVAWVEDGEVGLSEFLCVRRFSESAFVLLSAARG